ncbi:MAG: 2-succinyl-5-enolpyruvyl-6-hydroxy-3-cyclohexene-1-carboxylic-acid synthase [Lachnospiraceae bacterium]|nr:2-succinyl-5-enolpyruvyl-6-hydroxy-3-cyclohexene-1-carboxylic-acid synthase [Lachnospiraceae bacterium]MBO4462261.1 2-succinyl-5-enolpyruvyl-6-hydroxy-3-cyclohexene-1-carboxylic-acid synthase [Lachnospiraceae bacterium]
MYSKIKNVQYLVQLLKEHGVHHMVLSPGARDIPISHSVEEDPFFTCYSVVDERSAAYFAIGLSQQLGNEIVAIVCTSSVAASNYMPGITEAFYLKVPLLVITCDRNPRLLGQMENQMIDQVDMFKNFCKKCVNLPLIEAPEDDWYCQRLVNEAILEVKHHGMGPVQINVPISGGIGMFQEEGLPKVTKIERIEYARDEEMWENRKNRLYEAKKILVVCGQRTPATSEEYGYMEQFAKKYNCVIATERISNVEVEGSLNIYGACEVMPLEKFDEFIPDIVITLGGNFVSRIKDLLRARCGKFEHWSIAEDGVICDVVKSLTTVFECTPYDFFKYYGGDDEEGVGNDLMYFKQWAEYMELAKFPELEYSNSYAIKKLSEKMPAGSLMHLGILNATRIMSYCTVEPNMISYSNVGAFGIDGSMSTFMGQSVASPDKLCFLVIGDLSFFYDMNALQIKHVGKNVRIFLINNHGAAEFHYFMGQKLIPTINWHIAAEHSTDAEGWIKSRHFNYFSAHNKEEFDANIDAFINPNADCPQVFEIFTEKDKDADILKAFRDSFKEKKTTMEKVERKVEKAVKKWNPFH